MNKRVKPEDPAVAPEVLYTRRSPKGRVFAFQDGTQAVGLKRARAKLAAMRADAAARLAEVHAADAALEATADSGQLQEGDHFLPADQLRELMTEHALGQLPSS